MIAIYRTLQTLQTQLKGHKVRWFTDSANAVIIITKGSRIPDLQKIAVNMLLLCRAQNIVLWPVWLSRSANTIADSMSRSPERDDWALLPSCFDDLDALWGPHTVDRFATHYNAQLPQFNSKVWCPGTSGINCFLQDWSTDNNWLCPPVSLVVQTVSHTLQQGALATL